jgi:hypothetical protein
MARHNVYCDLCMKKIGIAKIAWKSKYISSGMIADVQHHCLDCLKPKLKITLN